MNSHTHLRPDDHLLGLPEALQDLRESDRRTADPDFEWEEEVEETKHGGS